MEYTREQLEAKSHELSLKIIEIIKEINSLKEVRRDLSVTRTELDIKISELQINDKIVPETLVVRKMTLMYVNDTLRKKIEEKQKLYSNTLLEMDNVSEDLIEYNRKEYSKR